MNRQLRRFANKKSVKKKLKKMDQADTVEANKEEKSLLASSSTVTATQITQQRNTANEAEKRTRGKGKRQARVHRSVRLDKDLADKIKMLSERHNRPESVVIRQLLYKAVNNLTLN